MAEAVENQATILNYLSAYHAPDRTNFTCDFAACGDPSSTEFRCIGAGTCGRIFHVNDQDTQDHCEVYKVEKHHHFGASRGLENESDFQYVIYKTFQKVSQHVRLLRDVHVPRQIHFGRNMLNDGLPPSGTELGARHTLVMEYIPSVQARLRHALLLHLQDGKLHHMGDHPHTQSTNRDCLIRPYLGKERDLRTTPHRTFTLRNYSICIADFIEIGLLVDHQDPWKSTGVILSRRMAAALATLHFAVDCDARDVEFVLGGQPIECESEFSNPRRGGNAYNTPDRDVHLWLLDFNQVGKVDWDIEDGEQGIEQVVDAFQANDPYYPRKGRGPPELWQAFRETYLNVASQILKSHGEASRSLPQRVINALEVAQDHKNQAAAAAEQRSRGSFTDDKTVMQVDGYEDANGNEAQLSREFETFEDAVDVFEDAVEYSNEAIDTVAPRRDVVGTQGVGRRDGNLFEQFHALLNIF